MRRAFVFALALSGCAAGGGDRAEAVGRSLSAQLAAQSAPGARLRTSIDPGPLATRIVSATVEGAYPGTGVARVVVDGAGRSYGVRGEHDLADLARARGWLAHPPDAASLARLVDDARFDGLSPLDDADPPALRSIDGSLELRYGRRAFPSGACERVTARFAATGPMEVTIAGPSPNPLDNGVSAHPDPWAAAERQLASGGPAGRAAALGFLRGRRDPRSLAVLARATTLGDTQLAADAIVALGSGDDAARALRDAWSPLPEARRAPLLKLAEEAWGPAFAAQLK